MKRIRCIYTLMLFVVALAMTGCNVTRYIDDDSYLLSRVHIKSDRSVPRDERITDDKDNLETYVRQSPNKRVFGFDFFVWVYEKINHEKDNWWNNVKRKIGQEPVLLNDRLTEKSVQNLKAYLDKRGYFDSEVTSHVDTTRRKKRAEVTYTIKQGSATHINNIDYEFRDSSLYSIVLADTTHSLLHRGDVLNILTLDEERARIASYLNNRGYFDFSTNNIAYEIDTTCGKDMADVLMIVRPTLAGYNERGTAIWEDNAIYRIRNIKVYPTYDPMLRSTSGFKANADIDTTTYFGLEIIRDKNATPQLRNSVLRRKISLYPSYIYNAEQVERTYSDLMSLGFFRNAKISFTHVPSDGLKYITYMGADNNGTGMLNTREEYLDCNIYCTPALKQSLKFELEASTTSTFYGLSTTVGYANSNAFRGAEAFDTSVRVGFEYMYAPDAKKRSALELGITAGLTFPRFLLPFRIIPKSSISQQRTRLELSFDYQNRPYYRRNLSSARWAYSWKQTKSSTFVLRPVDINWIDVKSVDEAFLADIDNEYLRTSFQSQLNAGLSFTYTYNNQHLNFRRNTTYVRTIIETSGNLIQGLESLFSHHAEGKNYYEILGIRYSQYVRAEINASHRINFGHDLILAGRFIGGVGVTYGNSNGFSIPFDRMFYCGGANSMRGWVPRTLGPGNNPEVKKAIYPAQVGDVRLEANIEFRFPIWWMFHGAIFFDAGNVWYLRDTEDSNPEDIFHINSFYKQLGFNTGIGLRFNIKVAVIRFDLGMQLHNPGRPEGQRWIKNLRWSNMALNFGVGYPF